MKNSLPTKYINVISKNVSTFFSNESGKLDENETLSNVYDTIKAKPFQERLKTKILESITEAEKEHELDYKYTTISNLELKNLSIWAGNVLMAVYMVVLEDTQKNNERFLLFSCGSYTTERINHEVSMIDV